MSVTYLIRREQVKEMLEWKVDKMIKRDEKLSHLAVEDYTSNINASVDSIVSMGEAKLKRGKLTEKWVDEAIKDEALFILYAKKMFKQNPTESSRHVKKSELPLSEENLPAFQAVMALLVSR